MEVAQFTAMTEVPENKTIAHSVYALLVACPCTHMENSDVPNNFSS